MCLRLLHIQALEHEKRLIRGLPLEQLDELEAKRHAAAATIQAHWRGAQQRQQLRQDFPALVSWSLAAVDPEVESLSAAHQRSAMSQLNPNLWASCWREAQQHHTMFILPSLSNQQHAGRNLLVPALLGWPPAHHLLLTHTPRRPLWLLSCQQQRVPHPAHSTAAAPAHTRSQPHTYHAAAAAHAGAVNSIRPCRRSIT
jgi:hypothetical protein